MYFYFDLHLVYFIMQNYPVKREWDQTDWLDPLVCSQLDSLKIDPLCDMEWGQLRQITCKSKLVSSPTHSYSAGEIEQLANNLLQRNYSHCKDVVQISVNKCAVQCSTVAKNARLDYTILDVG